MKRKGFYKHFLRCNTCNKLMLSISAYDYKGKPICLKCYRQVIDKFIEVLKNGSDTKEIK